MNHWAVRTFHEPYNTVQVLNYWLLLAGYYVSLCGTISNRQLSLFNKILPIQEQHQHFQSTQLQLNNYTE